MRQVLKYSSMALLLTAICSVDGVAKKRPVIPPDPKFMAIQNISVLPIVDARAGKKASVNMAALAFVTRAQGATITWTGGFPGGDVQVEGWVNSRVGYVKFYCHAPSGAGQLVVPPSILLALPPGDGGFWVTNTTAAQKVTGSGLDVGLAAGTVSFYLGSTFQ